MFLLLSVAEVNAGMAIACATKAPADPVLTFWMQLAKLMLENKLNDNGVAPNSPIRPRRRSDPIHVLKKREQFQGKYNPKLCQFERVRMMYLARPSSGCHKDTQDYCSCDPSMDLCLVCFGAHLIVRGG